MYSATEGFNDGYRGTADDYGYDGNGNMTKDLNKGIGTATTDGITYNYLNLPTKITLGTGTIEYMYDATGVKQRKKTSSGSGTTTTDYAGGFQYENNVLKFFPHPEGYVDCTNGTFTYIYQYKDHLGNVRLSYKNVGTTTNPSLQIVEENSYYPFGIKHKDNVNTTTSTNVALKYKYQGQERQDELGLNWDSFKWRNYDYAIGRFMSIDPLAEDYAYNSTYAFAENKLGLGRELEGCELGPLFGVAEIVKVSAEIGAKTSEVAAKTTEAAAKLAENASKGKSTEVEQLAKNGLEKNTKPLSATDPKTGKEGVTIPDAVKPGGGTVEIKNVGKQSLTEQLRLQKAISEGAGVKPELIINQTAKMSKPLQNAGFDIKTYSSATVIESTGVPKPNMSRVPIRPAIEMGPVIPGIY